MQRSPRACPPGRLLHILQRLTKGGQWKGWKTERTPGPFRVKFEVKIKIAYQTRCAAVDSGPSAQEVRPQGRKMHAPVLQALI